MNSNAVCGGLLKPQTAVTHGRQPRLFPESSDLVNLVIRDKLIVLKPDLSGKDKEKYGVLLKLLHKFNLL